MYQSIPKPPIPPPRAIPGHLTRVELCTVGNLTHMMPARWAFDLHVKTSVSGRKQKDFAILDSAREPCSHVIALVDSTWVFLLLSFFYSYIVEYAFV